MSRLKRLSFWGADEDDDSLPRAVMAGRKTVTADTVQDYYRPYGEYGDGSYEAGDLIEVYDLKTAPALPDPRHQSADPSVSAIFPRRYGAARDSSARASSRKSTSPACRNTICMPTSNSSPCISRWSRPSCPDARRAAFGLSFKFIQVASNLEQAFDRGT